MCRVKCIAFWHCVCISGQMYRVLWALCLYIVSNVSRSLGIVSVYRVKCIASFGNCVCIYIASNVWRPLGIAPVYCVKCMASFGNFVFISHQMYRALWALRLYISSNVSCPLGIASVYRVNSCLGRRQHLSAYPVECLHGEGGCGGVSTRVHHLQLGLVSRHPLRAL